MKTKKRISIVFFIGICFLFTNTALAQLSSKNAPLFLLQGAVKQKGKPIQGVELLLLKDGKPVAKIITPKNGLYYFQLNKSSTDTQSEYILKINKQGSVSGVLRINTYIPKEQFTTIPYLFYLDITFNPESTTKKDFGRINWFVEKNEFNFDKNYIPIPENEVAVQDSTLASKDSLINDSSANIKSIVLNNKVKDSLMAINTPNSDNSLSDKVNNTNNTLVNNPKDIIDPTNKTFADIIKTAAPSDKISTGNNNDDANPDKIKNNTQVNSKYNKVGSTSDKLKNEEVLNSSFIKNTNSKPSMISSDKKLVVKTTDNVEANKTPKNNTSSSTLQNLQASEKQKLNNNSQNKVLDIANKNNMPSNNVNELTRAPTSTMSKKDSLAANSSIQKDLFFLTGVPMGQFKTNLPSPNQGTEKTEVFDVNEIYSTNSERSHALSEKQRFERKKAENFAKKHETNNTLTSLMNEVDEFDKKNK